MQYQSVMCFQKSRQTDGLQTCSMKTHFEIARVNDPLLDKMLVILKMVRHLYREPKQMSTLKWKSQVVLFLFLNQIHRHEINRKLWPYSQNFFFLCNLQMEGNQL
jgi:hypothetical protein